MAMVGTHGIKASSHLYLLYIFCSDGRNGSDAVLMCPPAPSDFLRFAPRLFSVAATTASCPASVTAALARPASRSRQNREASRYLSPSRAQLCLPNVASPFPTCGEGLADELEGFNELASSVLPPPVICAISLPTKPPVRTAGEKEFRCRRRLRRGVVAASHGLDFSTFISAHHPA